MKAVAKLPKVIPFFFNATDKRDNGEFPRTFPFHVFYDNELSIFRHSNTKALKAILDKSYVKGSVLDGGMTDSIVGRKRVEDAIIFIKKHFGIKKGMRVLEIGCGEGLVVQRLAKEGVLCVGLEPGPQVLKLQGKNISIVNDFFPSKKIEGTFDLILHFGVMEHIDEPVLFLKKQKELLGKNGSIICAVPNCEPDIAAGDISLFYHQHYNYFTKFGIVETAKKAGLGVEIVEEGEAGGLIFARLTSSAKKKISFSNHYSEKQFIKNFATFNKAIIDFFSDVAQTDIAVYCPLRAMNLFHLLKITDCRLVDDNEGLHGKYLPAFNRKIESFEQIKKNPPKKILIYTKTFEKVIKEKCSKEKAFKNTDIKSVSDLL